MGSARPGSSEFWIPPPQNNLQTRGRTNNRKRQRGHQSSLDKSTKNTWHVAPCCPSHPFSFLILAPLTVAPSWRPLSIARLQLYITSCIYALCQFYLLPLETTLVHLSLAIINSVMELTTQLVEPMPDIAYRSLIGGVLVYQTIDSRKPLESKYYYHIDERTIQIHSAYWKRICHCEFHSVAECC